MRKSEEKNRKLFQKSSMYRIIFLNSDGEDDMKMFMGYEDEMHMKMK